MIEHFLWTTKRQEPRVPVEYLEQLIYDMWLCGTDPFILVSCLFTNHRPPCKLESCCSRL
jgi:hypothetical protein